MITKEYCLYEDAESLEELEKIKDTIWKQDPSEELNSEMLSTINAFHNGMGCECLDHD